MKKSLGIYVHIPFCVRKCLYCDFCSFPDRGGETVAAYTEELCRRIGEFAASAKDYTVDTVYFGGGTPTLLPIEDFKKILDRIFSSFHISEDCEISAECNPASCDMEYLRELRGAGVNRLSIGLQSIHDGELIRLGRAHDYSDFRAVFLWARTVGFDNISVDLMYGIPTQTVESFRESLDAIVKLRPEHVSAYCLKIEEGTPFCKMRDSLTLPDEDEEYEMYLSCSEILVSHGYRKYEISNFSLDGRESRHNLRYWRGADYIGFGVAAHSLISGVRFGNSRDISAFVRGEDITEERTELTDTDRFNEYLMLSLRLAEGISLSEFEERHKMSFFQFYPYAKKLVEMGYMRSSDGRIAFTDKGFFVSNSILSDMIETE